MSQFGLDVFSGFRWQERSSEQVKCGRYGHHISKHFSHICLKCRAGKALDGSIRAETSLRAQCIHDWEDVTNSCSLCWAKWEGEDGREG